MPLRVAVIGAGRMGQGIALALSRSGASVTLLGRRPKSVPAPLIVQVDDWAGGCRAADVILIATPDGVIRSVAERLVSEACISGRQTVLHLSGLLDLGALGPLQGTAGGCGSFHPLQTVSDPTGAPERLRGAYAGVEGDEAALAAGEALAGLLGMTPVRIPSGAKAAYHVGATLVANYTVALMGMAVRLAAAAGVPPDLASKIYQPLLHGAAMNLDRFTPAEALTGAIRRGDTATVRAHLAALPAQDRALYVVVGLEALALARQAGLEEEAAARVESVLRAATDR
jgi:predicted short-subunit dehydrogenase-like oxidoreductase (DUF2520 family)